MAESFAEKVKRINDRHFVNPKRLPKWMAKSALRIFISGLVFIGIVLFFSVKIVQDGNAAVVFVGLLAMFYFLLIGFSALYAAYRVKNRM